MATASQPVLKRLQCPNCGANIDQHAANAQTLICNTCGSFVAIGTETPEVTSKSPRKPPPAPKPIKLGMTGTLDGTEFFVIGRVVYTGWDPRDRSDKWTWHEWLLGGKDGRLLWLAHDEKGFSLYRRMRFRGEFDPERSSSIPLANGTRAMIRERYPAQIDGAEGELTWKATAGEQLYVAEGAGQGMRYSVQKTAQEMEIHEGKAISEADVATAFGDEQWAAKAQRSAVSDAIPTRAVVGVVCIIFAMLAFVAGSLVGSLGGSQMLNEQITLTSATNTIDVPLTINNTRRPHSVEISARTSGTSFPLTVNIIDPTSQQRLLFSQTLRPATATSTTIFSTVSENFVPFRSGLHQIRVSTSATSFDSASVTVEVKRNIWTSSWFTTFAIVIGLLGGFLFVTGIMNSVTTTKG